MKHDIPEDHSEFLEQCAGAGVPSPSPEFRSRICIYAELLDRCRSRMNLIGPHEMQRIWRRHILESVAFAPHIKTEGLVDIGTGAGFPGFILALLGFHVTIVEPRGRRCAFLEVAARECGVKCRIINDRVENSGPFIQDTVFTARSVKDPGTLIGYLAGTVNGPFRLLTRAPEEAGRGSEGFSFFKLPCPPLDRPGFILQYSHS